VPTLGRSISSRSDPARATPALPHNGRGVHAYESRADLLRAEAATGDARTPADTLPHRAEGLEAPQTPSPAAPAAVFNALSIAQGEVGLRPRTESPGSTAGFG
jgi:hypothetical protein